MLSLVALVFLPVSVVRAATTIYVTVGNGTETDLIGTLDPATGQFTEVAQTTQGFLALAAGPDGSLYGGDRHSGKLFTISASGATAEFGSDSILPSTFTGLAYSAYAANFYAVEVNMTGFRLHSISADGSSDSLLGEMLGQVPSSVATGDIALGHDGKLYFNYSTDAANGTNSRLYTVNPSNGALTAVGSGLGAPILSLFSDGETLYGLEGATTKNIGVYTIDTGSGAATRVSTVTGLPGDGSYYIEAAAAFIAAPPPAAPTVTVSTTSKMLVEGGPKTKIVFKRSGGDTTTDLTVNYKLGGTATNGTDYGTGGGQALGTSITIPAGATKAKLKVSAFADGVTEGKEKLALKLAASSTGAYTIGSPAKVKLSITDGQ